MTHSIRTFRQLGALIQTARHRRNLTQKSLADLVGTGQKTISQIENGHDGIRVETLFRIVAALDLELQLGPRSKVGHEIEDIF